MRLRRLKLEDAPYMLEWMHDVSVVNDIDKNFLNMTIENCIAFINDSIGEKYIGIAVVDEDDTYMGTIRLKNINHVDKSAELEIIVRNVAMQKGYSIYAIHEMLEYAHTHGIQKVYWSVAPENRRALKFFDKNNYQRVNFENLCVNVEYTGIKAEEFVWYLELLSDNVYGSGKLQKKIAVLTYPVKHRKTFDVLSLLKANGYTDVMVCAIPFHYQKKKFPIYQHRPEMNYSIPDIEIFCKNLNYQYKIGQLESFKIETNRLVLVAGAGILANEFVKEHTIINAHPGYIPDCRGLDAFKWAIIENKPIGVSTHLVGEYIDAGFVLERRKIDVYLSDTFHSLAQRVYENEVSMLVEAIEKYDMDLMQMIEPGNSEVHKRMPENIERILIRKFEDYKKIHAKIT
ncbi:MAG: GNAT family N-acetyltransferase [Lachnospiraceae bacterium]|nr:GNAT family N-acetyltransferase [Lachnospiraceae bacterium]